MVNYPHKKNGITVEKKGFENANKKVDFGRRGMSFEAQIVKVNEYYLASKKAVIHKKPTPVQIVKVDYPARAAAKITEAYFKTPSTTDFNGVFEGVYLDFEAKETTNKTSFPLVNIHPHQMKHIFAVADQGGFAFLLVKFSQLDQVYLLTADTLRVFWQEYELGTRKSIKHAEFVAVGKMIPTNTYPSMDYLQVVKDLINPSIVKDGYENEAK